jgi:protein TonB
VRFFRGAKAAAGLSASARIESALTAAPALAAGPAQHQRIVSPASSPRVVALAAIGSLIIHLLPLLLLFDWAGAPPEIIPPIPVTLIIEQPPLPAAEPLAPPPSGRRASDAMGEPETSQPPAEGAAEPADAASATQLAALPPLKSPSPELVSALPRPGPPPEPALAPLPEPLPLIKPPAKQAAAARLVPQARPRTARVPGPAATRDEYLAYCMALVRRHFDMLPASFLAGRHGATRLSIIVLDDGTIARVSVAQSSGYPDIDRRIEEMVAAVRRFPPLPQWFQGASMALTYHHAFPN